MSSDNISQVARFWNNSAAEFDSIYSGLGKSAFQSFLDQFFRRDMYDRFNWVMERSGDVRGKTICDFGCGSGRFVAEFASRGASHVTGVDIAPQMLDLARGLADRLRLADRVDFALTDILQWKTDQPYDITLAIGLWDYIRDPLARLRVIHSLTRATFLSAWPRFYTWRMPVRKLRLQVLHGCPVYFFRRATVFSLLESAGFDVVHCDTVGQLFCVESRPKPSSPR